MPLHIAIDHTRLKAFCRKWKVKELSAFGSALRDDFLPSSDVDLLVSFLDDAPWSLFDLVHMEEELSTILGRRIDLVDRRSVETSPNYIRRRHILDSLETIYVA